MKTKLPLHVVALCELHEVIRSFTTQNKSAIEIYREMYSAYGRYLYVYTDDTAKTWTHFPMNFNSWFVLLGKKNEYRTHLARRNDTQWQLHLHCVLDVFMKRLLRSF